MFRRLASLNLVLGLGLLSLMMSGCSVEDVLDPNVATDSKTISAVDGVNGQFGKMVIANRASGTISVLGASDGTTIGTFSLPSGPNTPEPMYVVYVRRTDAVIVGDRANDRVVEFDADDFSVQRTARAGSGVFHMWVDPIRNQQLWVNNDIDNTSTVIDPVTFDVLATVPMPPDLVADGGKPHDVILDPLGNNAFVTMLGFPGANDYVIKFDTTTFTELGRAAVGKDPHVALTFRNKLLYVPCQNSDVVVVLDRGTLAPVTSITVPGAHGAGMTWNGGVLYTTNLPGGGTDGIYAIDTQANAVLGQPVDTPLPVPHNLALTINGSRLFLTHSGATSDKVTFYAASAGDPTPALLGEVTVGLNPFGLAYVP
jgi:hypothetical protein